MAHTVQSTSPEDLRPPWWLKNPHLQSVLCSARIRAPRKNPMLDTARPKILEVDGHVRLLGLYSPREDRRAKGLAILLHGWEGSADSTYLLTTGRTLHRAGYDVFRLNLRDHGDSHHLNKGIFLASRLTEVRQAVARAAELAQGKPVFLIGFSLGGNFALRIARAARRKPVAGLRRVVAVSPVLDPAGSTAAIDSIRLFRVYFMKKWKRSLIKKQALYPGLYDFGPVLAQDNVWAMSQAMIDMFGQFKDLGRYFRSYRLTGPDLAGIDIPVTIITAKDDPVIPFDDFHDLDGRGSIGLIATRYGGHCGFIEGFSLRAWYEDKMVEAFDASL